MMHQFKQQNCHFKYVEMIRHKYLENLCWKWDRIKQHVQYNYKPLKSCPNCMTWSLSDLNISQTSLFLTHAINMSTMLNTDTTQSMRKLFSDHRTIWLIILDFYLSWLIFTCHIIEYRAKFYKSCLWLWQVNPKFLPVADKFCLTLTCDRQGCA